jgi:cytochrome P450
VLPKELKMKDDLSYDPFRWTVQDDPYPYYQRLREQAPVYHVAERDLWVVTRWDDCMALLTNPAQWSSARGNFFNDLPERLGLAMPTTDPPRHTELRSLVEQVLTEERIARLEPLIRATVGQLIAGFGHDEIEFVGAFAAPLTASIMGHLFGIPAADHARLYAWLSAAVHTSETNSGGAPAPEFQLMFGYIGALMRERRAAPGDDMISGLIAAEQDGRRLSDPEIMITIGTIIAAAIQSANMQFGNTLVALAQHPEQRDELGDHPGLIPNMIEESVRWDPAIQGLLRSAREPAELAGVSLPAGGWLLVSFASANRDERRFADPERFDIHRAIDQHLGFSWGPHTCIGRPLARLAMRVAFEELLPRLGAYQPLLERAQRTRNPNMRGYQVLPIRLAS